MLLRLISGNRNVDPRVLRAGGMLALVASMAWSHFAPASLAEDARDAMQGFLLGMSIALMLWSLVIQKRARR